MIKAMKKRSLCIVLVLAAVWFLRIINLDADLPGYDVSQYMPLDEGYYAMDAIKTVRPELVQKTELIDSTGLVQWDAGVSCFTTMLCTVSLFLFGNNYYGLRMASFFGGSLVLLLLLLILVKEKTDRTTKAVILGLAFTSFAFLEACRVVEPSMARMVFAMLMCYAFWKYREPKGYEYFVFGILSAVSVALAYPTNVFIIGAAGAMIILDKIRFQQKFFKNCAWYAAGGIFGWLVGEGICFLVQGRFFIQDFIRVVWEKDVSRVSFGLGSIKDGILRYLESNLFIYCPLLLILAALGVIYCACTGWQKKDRFRLFISGMAALHFLQSVFTNDFAYRKTIVIFPVLLLNILFLVKERNEIRNYFETKSVRVRLASRLALAVLSLAVLLLCTDRMFWIDPAMLPKDYPIAIVLLNISSVAAWNLCFWSRKQAAVTSLAAMGMVLALIPGLLMSGFALFGLNKTEKQAMLELNELVGENYVLGGFPYAYCLYNQIIPLSGVYDSYLGESYMERGRQLTELPEVQYYLGYQSEELINQWLEGTEYEWVLVQQMKTDFYFSDRVDGENDVFLYQKTEKE